MEGFYLRKLPHNTWLYPEEHTTYLISELILAHMSHSHQLNFKFTPRMEHYSERLPWILTGTFPEINKLH